MYTFLILYKLISIYNSIDNKIRLNSIYIFSERIKWHITLKICVMHTYGII